MAVRPRTLAALGLALAALGPATAGADATRTSRTHAGFAELELPAWVRAVQAGNLDLDSALVAVGDLRRAARLTAWRVGEATGSGPGLAFGLLAGLLGPRHGGADLIASLLEAPAVLSARPVDGELSSSFGIRRDPIRHRRRQNHRGIDIAAERGTPVHAAGHGVVVRARRERGYGRVIYVDHGGALQTRYAHLQSIGVEVGQEVLAGQPIGEVGSSGRATGPHLHFEVRESGAPVAPDRLAGLSLFGQTLGPVEKLLAPLAARAARAASTFATDPETSSTEGVKRAPAGKKPRHRPTDRRDRRSQRPQS